MRGRQGLGAAGEIPMAPEVPGVVKVQGRESHYIQRKSVTATATWPDSSCTISYSGKPRLSTPKPIVPLLTSTKRFCGKVFTGSSIHSLTFSGRRAAAGRERTSNVPSAAALSTVYDTGNVTPNL